MSYLVFDESWKSRSHAGIKAGTTILGGGLLGPLFAYSRFSDSSHQWFDNKFFNSNYHFNNDITKKIFAQCSKFSKPYSKDFENEIEGSGYMYKFNNQSDHAYEYIFRITKKIYDQNNKNFYLVKITFDDEKIYMMESIIIKNFKLVGFKKLDLNKILPKDKSEYKKK